MRSEWPRGLLRRCHAFSPAVDGRRRRQFGSHPHRSSIVRRRVRNACLPAMVCALLAAPAAPAATLSVDDDRKDCTAAAFTSVQDAIDAAAPGDTIAICPGDYAEGNAQPNTSAIKIDKTLTLKGAGADLVTITPLKYDGNDTVIAEDQDDTVPGSQ